jgi:uncharacterized delta-60 repeat protein
MKTKYLLIAFLLFANNLFAQDGTLDTTFNSTGKLITTLGFVSASFQSVAVQPDGKIICVGGAASGFSISDYDFAIVRYNSNGTLDNSFATNGVLKSDFNSGYDMATNLAIQPDGKIVVSGIASNGVLYDFAIIRLTSNGTFDNTFGTNGKATFDFNNSSDEAKKLVLQPDGKIIVAGFNTTIGAFAALRCNSNGTLDNSFGSNGKVTTAFNGAAMVSSIALQPDGKIIICGSDLVGGFPNFAMLRYTSSGALDTGFGTNGKTYIDPVSGSLNGNAIQLLSDGKIIAGGTLNGDFALLKFKSNGEADSTFGINGIKTKDLGGADGLSALQILSDGKILTGGSSTASSTNDFVVARFDVNGNIDGVFGNAGIATTSLSTQNDNLNGLTLTNTGKIIAVGNASNSSNGAIVCYKNSISSAYVANIFADNLDLNVYPNPASSELNIEVKGEKIEAVKITSINGQIMNSEFVANKININNLSSNLYFIEVKTANNIYRTKFIKE